MVQTFYVLLYRLDMNSRDNKTVERSCSCSYRWPNGLSSLPRHGPTQGTARWGQAGTAPVPHRFGPCPPRCCTYGLGMALYVHLRCAANRKNYKNDIRKIDFFIMMTLGWMTSGSICVYECGSSVSSTIGLGASHEHC